MQRPDPRFVGFGFRGSSERYCVEVSHLFRVEHRIPIFPLPWSRRGILGLSHIQSWWIPVIDLRIFLPDERGGIGNAVLVAQGEEDFVGFAVGSFEDTFTRRVIRKIEKGTHEYLPYRLIVEGKTYHLLDLPKLVSITVESLWNLSDDDIKYA